jgi:aspartate--ammonia ligase
LNGIERPVSFPVARLGEQKMEIVQSLAKWKRMALADYGYETGTGIYTDMNALRPDDEMDEIHSIYVDQWDWEMVMTDNDRTTGFLQNVVRSIYQAIRRTEFVVHEQYSQIEPALPKVITFIHAEEALERYPDLTPPQREKELAHQYGAVFIQGIGGRLSDGSIHGGRAPDYDDWSSPTGFKNYQGLNGDIVVWDPVRQNSLELSSMGIRVNQESLNLQLEITNTTDRQELYWHKRLLAGDFPQTIGGGIGQSRLCMFLLRKAHIGEVQAAVWPKEMHKDLSARGIQLM